MILIDLLAALSSNANVNITLMDDNDKVLITFVASGYEAVEDTLGARVVKRIKITSGTAITISLEDVDTNSNDNNSNSDPSDPSGDPSGGNP